MQIFDDKKRRVGVVEGFKNRSVTKTLSSGDKQLVFDYPANGDKVALLKAENYIRTKEDEYVIKQIEYQGDFNRYTAALNVEDLEGGGFPYGFASKEQTIRACLEFAFEGTGWKVGVCTITKKRTIDIDDSATAWDVLQECLKTYRVECLIHTLTKTIDIYEQIGQDRGAYIMEGLNLRKLTLKEDTYDFYTRIHPFGKDGIEITWINGKHYLENYQYSDKVKTYVWKDERYTNTTSLIEDAQAKLEEMSRPYKAYTADVLDLARASEEFADILDYGIGDTVTLISKSMGVKEKMRIVKIVEYDDSEKNTAELSSARLTFAQIQQEETAAAKAEAADIANRATKKTLEDYSTTEEIETKITASKEEIELGVMNTLESYYDKTETDAQIELSKGEIELSVSQTYQTKEDMEEYSTKEEVEAAIKINSDKIDLKVSKGDVSGQISVETGEVNISGNRMQIQSDNFKLNKTGEVEAKGKFTTKQVQGSDTFGSVLGDAGIRILKNGSEVGRVESGSVNASNQNLSGLGIKAVNVITINNGSTIGYIFNPTGVIGGYTERNIMQGGLRCGGDLSVERVKLRNEAYLGYASYDNVESLTSSGGFYAYGSIGCQGTKYRVVETENYGKVGLNALETPSAYFADIGAGIIGDDGKCYIMIDSEFRETISRDHEIYIQITTIGEGYAKVEEKNTDEIIVSGKEGTRFDWIMFAKQKNYETDRLERVRMDDPKIDYDDFIFSGDGVSASVSEDYMHDMEKNYDELADQYLINYEKELSGYD